MSVTTRGKSSTFIVGKMDYLRLLFCLTTPDPEISKELLKAFNQKYTDKIVQRKWYRITADEIQNL